MTHRFFIFLLFISLFCSCEDKKKSVESPPQIQEEPIKEPISEQSSPVKTESTTIFPLITSKNVVEFLTEYGQNNPETEVKITTQHGSITIELYRDTPLHRANFIYLIKQKYFDGTFFHRIVPNFIIQGGNSDNVSTPKKRNTLGPAYLIPAELNNQRIHTYGTVSGAKEYRENPDKQTAPYEFFIFLGPDKNAAHLNGNYTIFGRVTQGMEVVEKIANLPADEAEWPKQNVYISAEVMD